MKTIEVMPATLLPLPRELTQQEQGPRALAHEQGWEENTHAQLQDGLDDGVVPIGVAVVMVLRKL